MPESIRACDLLLELNLRRCMINSPRIVSETLEQSMISLFSVQKDDNFFTSRSVLQQNCLTEPFQAPELRYSLKLFSSSFLILAQPITNILSDHHQWP